MRFIDPIEGVTGEGVAFKWGVAPPARQAGENTAAGEEGRGGLNAAWEHIEEAAKLDALLDEASAPDPGMADYWRTAPELWASLSEGGRETLSRSMFGITGRLARGISEEASKGLLSMTSTDVRIW